MTTHLRSIVSTLLLIAAILLFAFMLEQFAFHIGVAHAQVAGSGSGSAATLPPTLHDPSTDPIASISDLQLAWKMGWPFAVLVGVIFVCEALAWLGKKYNNGPLAALGKGRVSLVIGGVISVGLAMFNAVAAGGKWSAALLAIPGAVLTYWHIAGTDPAKS